MSHSTSCDDACTAFYLSAQALVQSIYKPGTVLAITLETEDDTPNQMFVSPGSFNSHFLTMDDLILEGVVTLSGMVAATELAGSTFVYNASLSKARDIANRFVDIFVDASSKGMQRQTQVSALVEAWIAMSRQCVHEHSGKLKEISSLLVAQRTLTVAQCRELFGSVSPA